MQATNSGLDDDAFLGRLDFSGFWRILVERQMTAGIVISDLIRKADDRFGVHLAGLKKEGK